VVISWIVVVLLLAGMIGVAAWWLGNGRWTTVPELAGLQRSAVEATLADADLDTTITEDHHDTVPDGTVISSDPGTGIRALRGSDVIVVLSLGHPVVPDLPVGTSAEDAEQAIREADLTPQPVTAAQEYHDTVPAGTIIGLQPASGTVLTVGAPVTLVISKGPAPTAVPQVRGLPEAEAIAALTRAGLTAQVRREFDNEVPGGQAVGTDPEAGTETARGTDVVLVVSTALIVPDVVGQSREPALAALAAAGLQPRERGDGAGKREARVRAVQPGAGSLVDPAHNAVTVQLTTEIAVPEVVGMSVAQARQVLAAAGLNSDVRQFFGDESSTVVTQSPGPGRTVRPGDTVRLRTF
jgi:serine/threonine-protein kinase